MSPPTANAEPVGAGPKIVEFDGPSDRDNPRNWAPSVKISSTLLYGLTTMGATWSSAIYSTAVNEVAAEFTIDTDVAQLGTSLLLMGFALGPLLWAPLSELYGRRCPVLLPYFLGLCFTFGTAVSADFPTVVITRFFAGFFSSAPISITGGALADMFDPRNRGLALVGYAGAVVGGPVFAPVVGSAIIQSGLGWRWTQYVTAIYMGVILVLDYLFLQESYVPVLLTTKARRLRLATQDWALHAKHEEWDPSFREMTNKFLLKPIQLLGTPICFLFALHASFVYAIVYINLSVFPIVFLDLRGWGLVEGSLPFLGLLLGIICGGVFNLKSQKFYLDKVAANNGRAVPEARLPPMMAGSLFITVGLFLIGNTANPSFHWTAPVSAAVVMGFSFFTIFQAALSYLVDTFPAHAASAVAANTFARSMLASVFPPIVSRIYGHLGVIWTLNMLGFVALAMIPIPWLFYYFGKSIRGRGEGLKPRHEAPQSI